MQKLLTLIAFIAAVSTFGYTFTDVDNPANYGKGGIPEIVKAVDANFAMIEANQIVAGATTVTGTEGANASLVLDADDGDDAADTWTLNSSAATNELEIKNDTSTLLAVTSAGRIKAAYGKGAAAGTGVSAVEYGNGIMHQTVLAFSDVEVDLVDNAGVVAHGALKIYDLPEGAIVAVGVVTDLALTKTSTGVSATWDGDVGVGTTAADTDASLATTEQNLMASTATPQAVAGVTTADGQSATAEHIVIDGTATAADVYLNLLVDDADHDVTAEPCKLVVNGTMTITWIQLGDN